MILNCNSLTQLRSHAKRSINVLDIGTGTGAIAISLLVALPFIKCTAIDINEFCIRLSKRNAESILGKEQADQRFKAVAGSYQDFVRDENNIGKFDLIVTNPPYIPSKDIKSLQEEVEDFEDKKSLDGGRNANL